MLRHQVIEIECGVQVCADAILLSRNMVPVARTDVYRRLEY